MATVSDLYDLADLWLEASIDALAATPFGPPDRAYVSPGQPSIDCEQLVVWSQTLGGSLLNTLSRAEAKEKLVKLGTLARVTIQIQIVRCIPAPKQSGSKLTFPSATEMATAAQTIDEDAWALWLGLGTALKDPDGLLHEPCSGAERLGGEKLLPQGGFGGWTFSFRIPIEGGRLTT